MHYNHEIAFIKRMSEKIGTTYVKPKLECSVSLWSPYLMKNECNNVQLK